MSVHMEPNVGKGMDHANTPAKLHELVEKIHIAMLTTSHGLELRSRPMGLMRSDQGETLWFFTSATSPKVDEITEDSRVNVSFADEGKNLFISVFGRAAIVRDVEKAKEMWTPIAKAWFDGPEDPDLRLIRITVEGAEYWEGPGSKIANMITLAVSAITGKPIGMSESETIKLP